MSRYNVRKETYDNKLIEDLGQMTINEIKELARGYLGDVFKNERHIEEVMDYIEENGQEMWLCNGGIQISIEVVR